VHLLERHHNDRFTTYMKIITCIVEYFRAVQAGMDYDYAPMAEEEITERVSQTSHSAGSCK
jgi:hypothetical protein